MNDKPKYACAQCGETEFVTKLNSYDIYKAVGDELHWQSTEIAEDDFVLYCRECSERAHECGERAAK